jgi:WD40 repeat protein
MFKKCNLHLLSVVIVCSCLTGMLAIACRPGSQLTPSRSPSPEHTPAPTQSITPTSDPSPTNPPSETPTPTNTARRTPLPTQIMIITRKPNEINTLVPTKTSTVTRTLLPTIVLPVEIISSQNILQIEPLTGEGREFEDQPDDFFVRDLAFTPDGSLAAASDNTGKVYIWDVMTSQLIRMFKSRSQVVWAIGLSPDGQLVAAADGAKIRLWELATGLERYTFNLPSPQWNEAWSFTFSLDSKILVSSDFESHVAFWDTTLGTELSSLVESHGYANSLAFSPDGKYLATGADYQVTLWDLATNQPLRTFDLNLTMGNGSMGILGVQFSPDGKKIAAASGDNIAMLWDVDSGEMLNTIIGEYTIIRLNAGALAFSVDGSVLAAGMDNGEVILWDILQDKELRTISSPTCFPIEILFWPEGTVMSVGCANGAVQLWGVPR